MTDSFKSFLKRKRLADFRSSLIACLVAIKVQRGFDRVNFKSIINRYCKQKRKALAKEVLERMTLDPSELHHNHKEQMSDLTRAR